MDKEAESDLFDTATWKRKEREAATRSRAKTTIAETDLNTAYENWLKYPSPATMGALVQRSTPFITSAMNTYVKSNNPSLKSKAKRIVIDAIKTYDPSKGSSLRSWITLNLQGLQRYSAAMTPLSVPERLKLDAVKVSKARFEFAQENGREPTTEEIVKLTSITPKRLNYINKVNKPILAEGTLDSMENADDDMSFVPGVHSTDWQSIWGEYVYSDLSPLDKEIYDMRLNRGAYKDKPISIMDMSKKFNISPAAISQRTTRIADKLAEGFDYEGKY